MVNKNLRNRRCQISAAEEQAPAEKAVGCEVDPRADAIKPTDAVVILIQRFAMLDTHINELEIGFDSQALSRSKTAAQPLQKWTMRMAMRTLDGIWQRSRSAPWKHQGKQPSPPFKKRERGQCCRNTAIGSQSGKRRRQRPEETGSAATGPTTLG
jgi:hypothetical protein